MNDTPKNTPENENEIDFNNDLDTDVSATSESDNTFDIELESLDDFLKNDDDTTSDDTFSLEEEDLITMSGEEKKGGSATAKVAGYVVLLAMLGGLGYAGVKYVPQLTGADEMGVFEQNMFDRSDNLEQDMNVFSQVTQEQAANALMPSADDQIASMQAPAMNVDAFGMPINDPVQPMPMALDVIPAPADDFIVTDGDMPFPTGMDEFVAPAGEAGMNDLGFDGPVQANSISDIVEITQAAEPATPAAPVEPVTMAVPMEAFPVTDVGVESTFAPVPTAPVLNESEEDLPPVSDDRINAVDNVMNQDPAALIADVEAQADTPVTTSTETQVNEMNDMIIVEDQVPSAPPAGEFVPAPVVEATPQVIITAPEPTQTAEPASAPAPIAEPVIDVPEVKAVPPVRTVEPKTKAAPKPAQVETKPAINAAAQLNTTNDPRINEGRIALRAGDFTRATQIFDAVLRENPANVHALTGKQMAVSKIRYTGNDVAAPVSVVEPAPAARPTDVFVPRRSVDPAPLPAAAIPAQSVTQPLQPQPPLANVEPPVVNVNTANIQTILAQANANPRDASLALNVGDAFRAAGDRAKAAEWYRKALQLDAVYSGGIDRMSVYDRLATVQ